MVQTAKIPSGSFDVKKGSLSLSVYYLNGFHAASPFSTIP
jgi:hypothetical protein